MSNQSAEVTVGDVIDSQPSPTRNQPNRRGWANRLQLNRLSGVYLWAIIIVVFALWIPNTFLTVATFQGIFTDQAITVILALGVLVALAAGQYDLSAAQVLGFSAVLTAYFNSVMHLNPTVTIVLTVAIAILIGLFNGLMVAVVGINSFIATLASSSIILALTSLVSGDRLVGPVTDEFKSIALGNFFGAPVTLIYVAVIAVVVWYVVEHSPIGRKLNATGANIETARLVGVSTKKYVIMSLVISGLLAGVAGILLSAKIGTVSSTIGPAYLLPAFAGCFLGTTQFRPGRFNVWGTVLSLFLLATGVKGFQLASGQNWITYLFNGCALLLAVGLAVVFERRRTHSRAV